MSDGYPTIAVKNESGEILGFGMLRAHNFIPTFSHTAEITYFKKPEYTGNTCQRMTFFLTNIVNLVWCTSRRF